MGKIFEYVAAVLAITASAYFIFKVINFEAMIAFGIASIIIGLAKIEQKIK